VTLLARLPAGCDAERRYAVGVVLGDLLGLRVDLVDETAPGSAHVTITVADGTGGEVRVADDLLGRMTTDWFDRQWLPAGRLDRWNTDGAGLEEAALVEPTLPVLYGRPTLERDGDTTTLGLDLFGAAFAMATRYEEAVGTGHDTHGRFPATASIAAREGYLDRPLLDEYAEVLWAVLRRHWPRLERRPHAYSLWLSHDVDIPRSAGSGVTGLAKWVAADVVRRREPALAARRVRAYPKARHGLAPEDPANTFDLIMDVSERQGLHSAFYFIPTEGSRDVDARYRLEDPWVRGLLRRIHDRGHEIGLHASYETFRDPDLTRSEFDCLRAVAEGEGITQPAWGGRQHYLRWDPATTWRNWDAAGVDYDSTMTFHDVVGFRSGTCREHGLFDLRARTPLRLRERPVVAMDATLKGYMGLDDDELVRRVTTLADRCRLVGGPMSLLWHNHNLASRADRETYGALVAAIAS
jgi:hypothetical protein